MIKIKNVRPGMLILSDAKLKLAPGETADVETLSVQMQQCLDNGLLVQVTTETETEVKPKAKSTAKKTAAQTAATEQSQPVEASTDTKVSTEDGGQGQLIEAGDAHS